MSATWTRQAMQSPHSHLSRCRTTSPAHSVSRKPRNRTSRSTCKCQTNSTASAPRLATSAPSDAATTPSLVLSEVALLFNRLTELVVRTRALLVSSINSSTPYTHPHKHVIVCSQLVAVETTQTLEGISAQILQNKKDFPAAVAANQAAGAAGINEGAAAISGAFHSSRLVVRILSEPRLTFPIALITATVNPNAAATPPAAAGNGNANQNQNANGNGKGKGGNNGNARGGGNAANNNAGNAANQQAGNGNAANGQQNANNAAAGQAGGNANQNANGNGNGQGGRGGRNAKRRALRSKFLSLTEGLL